MVAAATLLSTVMTTTTTRALISSSCNDWQQQHSENYKLTTKKTNNNQQTIKMRNSLELMGEQDQQQQQQQQQQQHNGKHEIEEMDCKQQLLDSYEGETSNNSSDWKCFRWSPESTRLMLRLRFERQVEFQCRNRQKKDLWAEIANEMRKEGNYHTTGEVCDLKYRNMLQTYKKNYLKEARGMHSQIAWEYYEMFKEAMKSCDDLVPSQLCDTVCEIDDDLMEIKTEMETPNEEYNTSECTTIKESTAEEEVDNQNTSAKRRAPSARVQANNSKRIRPANLNSQVEVPPAATAQAPVAPPLGGEFDWSRLPPLEPKPSTSTAVTRNPISPPQLPTTIQPQPAHFPTQPTYPPMQTQQYPMAPPWLTDSELREYFSYGESVGLQIAHIRDPRTRAFLQLKIQETLFLAKVDKLNE